MKKSNIKNNKNQNLMNSYMFRATLAISNQTLHNWEKRGKIQVIRRQIHHVKIKYIVLDTLENIPKKYLTRIDTLKKGQVLNDKDYNHIIKAIKN